MKKAWNQGHNLSTFTEMHLPIGPIIGTVLSYSDYSCFNLMYTHAHICVILYMYTCSAPVSITEDTVEVGVSVNPLDVSLTSSYYVRGESISHVYHVPH